MVRGALEALGREVLLHQGDPAVEDFRIAGDPVALELKAAHALEHHGPALGAEITETIAGIAEPTVRQKIEEIPAVVRAGFMETRQHVGDVGCPRMDPEEAVVVDRVVREQGG